MVQMHDKKKEKDHHFGNLYIDTKKITYSIKEIENKKNFKDYLWIFYDPSYQFLFIIILCIFALAILGPQKNSNSYYPIIVRLPLR